MIHWKPECAATRQGLNVWWLKHGLGFTLMLIIRAGKWQVRWRYRSYLPNIFKVERVS